LRLRSRRNEQQKRDETRGHGARNSRRTGRSIEHKASERRARWQLLASQELGGVQPMNKIMSDQEWLQIVSESATSIDFDSLIAKGILKRRSKFTYLVLDFKKVPAHVWRQAQAVATTKVKGKTTSVITVPDKTKAMRNFSFKPSVRSGPTSSLSKSPPTALSQIGDHWSSIPSPVTVSVHTTAFLKPLCAKSDICNGGLFVCERLPSSRLWGSRSRWSSSWAC
jgi:hypothetical protein